VLNRKKFVDGYVNHAFNASVETVFQEFMRGFFEVCDRDLVRLFRPKELQEALVGEDFQDWENLKQVPKHMKFVLNAVYYRNNLQTLILIPASFPVIRTQFMKASITSTTPTYRCFGMFLMN